MIRGWERQALSFGAIVLAACSSSSDTSEGRGGAGGTGGGGTSAGTTTTTTTSGDGTTTSTSSSGGSGGSGGHGGFGGTGGVGGTGGSAPAFEMACATGLLGGSTNQKTPIATASATAGAMTYTRCPSGADANANPPVCTTETSFTGATLSLDSTGPTDMHVSGTIAIRIQDLVMGVDLNVCTPSVHAVFNADAACPGGTFVTFPIDVSIVIDPNEDNSLSIAHVVEDEAATMAIVDPLHACAVPGCNGLCCITDACACALAATDPAAMEPSLEAGLLPDLKTAIAAQLDAALCLSGDGACTGDAIADASGICRHPDGSCEPAPGFFADCSVP